MHRRGRLRGASGAVAAAALASGTAVAAATGRSALAAAASSAAAAAAAFALPAAAAAAARCIHTRSHPQPQSQSHPPAFRSVAPVAATSTAPAPPAAHIPLAVPRRVLEQLAAPRGPAAPAVPEPVSAEEAATATRTQELWGRLAQPDQQETNAAPAPSSALTAAAAARARAQAILARRPAAATAPKAAIAPSDPSTELRVRDADVLVRGQSLPIQWLLQELGELVAEADPAQSPSDQLCRLQRCDEILTELYKMVFPAPAHSANTLSLANYSCILRAIALDAQPTTVPDIGAAESLDGILAPVAAPSESEAAATAAIAAVELHKHALPFVRLLLFQVECSRPEPLRTATMNDAALREFTSLHQLERPLLRLPQAPLREIVQRGTDISAEDTHLAASLVTSAAIDLLQRVIAQLEVEAGNAARAADRPWQELLPTAFKVGTAPTASAGISASGAAPTFVDEAGCAFDVPHLLTQLEHLSRVQHGLKSGAEHGEQADTDMQNMHTQLQHVSSRAAQVLQDLHSALVAGAGAHVSLPDLERVLTIHVPQLRAYHLALPLFEQLVLQRQMAYDTARATQISTRKAAKAEGRKLRRSFVPFPSAIPARVTASVMACIPLAQPHSSRDALRMHKLMNDMSPRNLCTYDVEPANQMLRAYALRLQPPAGSAAAAATAAMSPPELASTRTAMLKDVKVLHHFMRVRNGATHTLLLQSMAWAQRHSYLIDTFDFMRTDASIPLDRHAFALYAEALVVVLPQHGADSAEGAALRTRADTAWEAARRGMLMTGRLVTSLARFWQMVGDTPRLLQLVCTANQLQSEQRQLVDVELIAQALTAAAQAPTDTAAADTERLRTLIQSLDADTQTQLQARTPVNVIQFLNQSEEELPVGLSADGDTQPSLDSTSTSSVSPPSL